MAKNVVVCSDGTGNTFDRNPTNVTRLVHHLDLRHPDLQVVLYDQGVGTTRHRARAVRRTTGAHEEPCALGILPAPIASWGPAAWSGRVRGLITGYGLRENLRQMYTELARCVSVDDTLFLFGYSRGAFTVRALAGLLHRCWLPYPDARDLNAAFDVAWELFRPTKPQVGAVAALRAQHRPCPIHFLGVWDTVKSYGGLNPVMLPHLRHNPAVQHVRHALALDERRAWFKPTTWGQLDLDRANAMTRLELADLQAFTQQDIAEVWFTGSHGDVGGGRPPRDGVDTARIALRWMLAEAAAVTPPLLLTTSGNALLAEEELVPQVHSAWTLPWRIVEQIPRLEIHNNRRYPRRVLHQGSDGARNVTDSRRCGRVGLHVSALRPPQLSEDAICRYQTGPAV